MGRILKTDLFDEACGEGIQPLLASRARTTVGVDLSVSAVRFARYSHPGLLAAAADVRHLPFSDGVFDAVVSNSTLDHFPCHRNILAAVRELYRVLREGASCC